MGRLKTKTFSWLCPQTLSLVFSWVYEFLFFLKKAIGKIGRNPKKIQNHLCKVSSFSHFFLLKSQQNSLKAKGEKDGFFNSPKNI